MERASTMTQMTAAHRYRGPATIFWTMNPDDVHSPDAIRSSFPYNGDAEFPAKIEGTGFMSALQGHGPEQRKGFGPCPCDERALQNRAANNPIATTVHFNRLMKNVVTHLVGINTDGAASLKNTPTHDGKKGIWGRATSLDLVKECDKRGSEHLHSLFRGGLTPALLADVVDHPELQKMALDAVTKCHMAELPLEYHAVSVAQQELKIGARRDVAFVLTMLDDDVAVKRDEKKVEKIVEKVKRRKKEKVEEKKEEKWREMEVEREVQLTTAERKAVWLTKAELEVAELTKAELAAAERLTEMEWEDTKLTEEEDVAVTDAWWRKVNVKAQFTATNKHVHAHCRTCMNGPRGKIGCRLNVPFGHDIEDARFLQLHVPDPGQVPETELRPPPPSEANETVEFRCTHCHADGALHPSTPDDPEAVRRSDDISALLFTAKKPTARESRRDRRALTLDFQRRCPPAPDEQLRKERGEGIEAADDELEALVNAVGKTRKPRVFPATPEGDRDAHATLARMVAPGQPLAALLEQDGLQALRKKLHELAEPPIDASGDDAARQTRGEEVRNLLDAWQGMTCRNGIVADWSEALAACTGGNAVPYHLGAGMGSKAAAMCVPTAASAASPRQSRA